MGASNSKPQTVQMANPQPFLISREVMERIEQATKPAPTAPAEVATASPAPGPQIYCDKCQRSALTPLPQPTAGSSSSIKPVAAPWQKRSIEIEEMQFGKTLERVHELFGKPVKWAQECSGEIVDLEERLIFCYREYPQEPLACAPLAKQYHRFVFAKQFAEMIKPDKPKEPKSKANK